jgi:type II secretory pathway pseudopilin PulG
VAKELLGKEGLKHGQFENHMSLKDLPQKWLTKRQIAAFTLVEVTLAVAIIAMVFSTIILAYTQTTRRAEWSGYSLAAHAQAIQQIEQARAAVWDPAQDGANNQLTNLNLLNANYDNATKKYTGYSWDYLDLPISTNGTPTAATNYVTVVMFNNITAVNKVYLQMVRVDTVWPWTKGRTTRYFTNTICTYIGPDNRDNSTF